MSSKTSARPASLRPADLLRRLGLERRDEALPRGIVSLAARSRVTVLKMLEPDIGDAVRDGSGLRAVGTRAAVGVVRFDSHPGLGGKSGDTVFAG